MEESLERLPQPVPKQLILGKDDEGRAITIYDVIARFIGLVFVKKDIYTDKKGQHYVRTKYGFVPAEQINQQRVIEEQSKEIEKLGYELKMANSKIEDLKKTLAARKEFTKEMFLPIQEKIQSTNKEKKALKQELKELKKNLFTYKNATQTALKAFKKIQKAIDLNSTK